MPAIWSQCIGKLPVFWAKSTVCSLSISATETLPVGCFSLHIAIGARRKLAPPSQAAARRHFPYPSFNCSLHREEGKTHLNPANSGTRINAGEEYYFAVAGGLQGALLLQWCRDASLLMNCSCEITKHTVTKSSKETSSSNSAHHPIAPGLQLVFWTEKSKKNLKK